jgi:hypothetical protein
MRPARPVPVPAPAPDLVPGDRFPRPDLVSPHQIKAAL